MRNKLVRIGILLAFNGLVLFFWIAPFVGRINIDFSYYVVTALTLICLVSSVSLLLLGKDKPAMFIGFAPVVRKNSIRLWTTSFPPARIGRNDHSLFGRIPWR
jgi:hypothetical protein